MKNASGPAIWEELNGYAYDDEGRRIAYRPWFQSAWTINDVVARAQFDELAPEAVRYTASMIDYIIQNETINLCGSLTGTWRLDYSYGAECAYNSGFEIIELVDDGEGGLTGTITGADDRLGPTTGFVTGTLTGNSVHLTRRFSTGFVAGATRTFDGTVSGDTMTGRIGTCGSGATPAATYRLQFPAR